MTDRPSFAGCYPSTEMLPVHLLNGHRWQQWHPWRQWKQWRQQHQQTGCQLALCNATCQCAPFRLQRRRNHLWQDAMVTAVTPPIRFTDLFFFFFFFVVYFLPLSPLPSPSFFLFLGRQPVFIVWSCRALSAAYRTMQSSFAVDWSVRQGNLKKVACTASLAANQTRWYGSLRVYCICCC